MKKIVLLFSVLFAVTISVLGQPTQLAAWTFDGLAAAPSTPGSVLANLGSQSGTAGIYADGTNGSSVWITATAGNELTAFTGTTINDPRGTPAATMSYCPVGGTGNSANGKCMVIKYSMTGFQDPVLTYATRNTSTGFQTQQWAWSTDNITYNNFQTVTGITTSFATKTLDMSTINNLDQATTVYLKITYTGATTSSGNNRIDNIVINATPASVVGATKLAITSVNGGNSPSANTPFPVVVQSQDNSSLPANVTSNTNFTLSVATGTGTLGGTITGTITAGTNSVTVTGVTYSVAETGVSITATQTAGDPLTPGTSSTFSVLAAADHLVLVNVPAYGVVATNLNTFTVQAQRPDNTVDANYVTDITMSLATGPGNLSGTVTKTPVAGIATFNNLQLDAAGTYTLNAASGSLTGATTGNIEIATTIDYRSKLSGAWNSVDTWEALVGSSWLNAQEVPTSPARNVTIRNGHSVNVPASYNTGACKDLTVEAGATLYANLSTGSCFVYVYGDILNDGIIGGTTDVIGFDIEGTSCLLGGTGTFDAARIAKFTTTNTTTNLTINQDLSLHYTSASSPALRNGQSASTTFNITLSSGKHLTVKNAPIDLAGCTLTIQSDASLLDNGTVSNSTAANTTVERSISAWTDGAHGWHFLSAPVAAQNIQPEFVPDPIGDQQDFYSWSELTNEWNNCKLVDGTWNPAFETAFEVGKGYLVAYGSNVTKSFKGALNVASVTNTTMTYTPAAYSGSSIDPGWNLLGNPFCSAVTWDPTTWALSSNIETTAKIWNEAGASYTDIPQGGIIPALQGFMVRVNDANPSSLTIPASARVHSAQAWYKESGNPRIRLMAKDEATGTFQESVVVFNNLAAPGYDLYTDARFLQGYAPAFYSMEGQNRLSTNVLPALDNQTSIPFGFVKTTSSDYTIEAVGIENLPGQVYLNDLKLSKTQNLSENPVYAFTAEAGDNPARFMLSFGHVGINENGSHGNSIYASGNSIVLVNPGTATLELYTVTGQKLLTRTVNSTGLYRIATSVPTGYYLVRLIAGSNVVVSKVFMQQ